MSRSTHFLALLLAIGIPCLANASTCSITVLPNHHDDTGSIAAAIARCASVQLGPGVFHVSRPINLRSQPSGLTIKGAGRGVTVIHSTIGRGRDNTDVRYAVFLFWDPYDRVKRLVRRKVEPGSYAVEVDEIRGLKAGDSILINSNGRDSASEFHKIKSIAGRTLTLAKAVHRPYPVAGTHAHVWKARWIRNLRISDLTITGKALVAIEIPAAELCSIERVEIGDDELGRFHGPWRGKIGINFDNAGRANVIRDCTVIAAHSDSKIGTAWAFSLESQHGSTIEDCSAMNAADGFSVNFSTNISVVNVRAQSCTVGLIVNGDHYGEPSKNVSVIGSRFTDGNTGILIQPGSMDIEINDCVASQNSENGIAVGPDVRQFAISGVSTENNGSWGIAVEPSDRYCGNIDGVIQDCGGTPSRLGRVGGAVDRVLLDDSCTEWRF